MTMYNYQIPPKIAKISRALAEKRSSYRSKLKLNDVQEPINTAPEEVQQIIQKVLEVEKDKLYQKTPRYINDDILNIIKEVIQ
jgi:hypothetical protein